MMVVPTMLQGSRRVNGQCHRITPRISIQKPVQAIYNHISKIYGNPWCFSLVHLAMLTPLSLDFDFKIFKSLPVET